MSKPLSADQLVLVRHTPVSDEYLGLCYGRSDVPLRSDAREEHDRLARQLAHLEPRTIIHSGLERTRMVAERLAQEFDCLTTMSPELRERDFGSWELQPWDAIHQQYGDDMMRMISEPGSFRPGGGETTYELRDRVVAWYESLSLNGTTIVVTHGGPIAALLGTLRGLPVESWAALIPPCGQWIAVPHRRRELV